VPGVRDAWAPNATSHHRRCLGPTLPETRVMRYLTVSRSPQAYRGSSLLPGWMDKATKWRNPAGPRIIGGWRSGNVVCHPVWFILSWGPYVQPLEVGSSPDMGCVGPVVCCCGKPIVSGILGCNWRPALPGVMTPTVAPKPSVERVATRRWAE
jgi:hypothetical protein